MLRGLGDGRTKQANRVGRARARPPRQGPQREQSAAGARRRALTCMAMRLSIIERSPSFTLRLVWWLACAICDPAARRSMLAASCIDAWRATGS